LSSAGHQRARPRAILGPGGVTEWPWRDDSEEQPDASASSRRLLVL